MDLPRNPETTMNSQKATILLCAEAASNHFVFFFNWHIVCFYFQYNTYFRNFGN